MTDTTSSSYIFPSTSGSTASLDSSESQQPELSHSYHEIAASDNDEIDSLPSSDDSSDISDVDEFKSDAQKEWEASLQQLELLLTMVVVPYMGKYFGRKFAYWGRWWGFYKETVVGCRETEH